LGKYGTGKGEIERQRNYAKIEMENRFILERLGIAMSKKTIDNDESEMSKFSKSLTQTRRFF